MKLLSVIARYNEDLSWVNNLKCDCVIYNKGNKLDLPCINTENYGRESETYTRFIIDWYDEINNFDSLVFLQGNPYDHSKYFMNLINDPKANNLVPLSDYKSYINLSNNKNLSNINDFVLGKILGYEVNIDLSYLKPDYNEFTKKTEKLYSSQILEVCGIMGINEIECTWAPGAQYIVPKDMILNKSFDWWLNLHKLHKVYEDNLKDVKSLPHILERMWPLIWNHKT